MRADSSQPQGSSIAPLPRGRHKLPQEVVVANQRERVIVGAARCIAERGYAATSVADIITAAGVSRTTFYASFSNKRDCVIKAHEATFERLAAVIFRACASQRERPLKVRAAIAESLAFVAEDPQRARLLFLDALAADLVVARRVLDSNAHLAALLDAGREQEGGGRPQSELTAEALIGAIASIVSGRLFAGQPVDDLEPQLVTFALTPYIGSAEARRVATEPLPAPVRDNSAAVSIAS
jgi:AcrR family transcriptional regulator